MIFLLSLCFYVQNCRTSVRKTVQQECTFPTINYIDLPTFPVILLVVFPPLILQRLPQDLLSTTVGLKEMSYMHENVVVIGRIHVQSLLASGVHFCLAEVQVGGPESSVSTENSEILYSVQKKRWGRQAGGGSDPPIRIRLLCSSFPFTTVLLSLWLFMAQVSFYFWVCVQSRDPAEIRKRPCAVFCRLNSLRHEFMRKH